MDEISAEEDLLQQEVEAALSYAMDRLRHFGAEEEGVIEEVERGQLRPLAELRREQAVGLIDSIASATRRQRTCLQVTPPQG